MIGFGVVYALIEQPHLGWLHPLIYGTFIGGIVTLVTFVWYEKHVTNPMLPFSLFAVRNFTVGNLATTSIYAGLSVATFLITIFVQQVGHYGALAAGLSILPVTIIMFFLSSRFGGLSSKYGPRLFMTIGPIVVMRVLVQPSTMQYRESLDSLQLPQSDSSSAKHSLSTGSTVELLSWSRSL